MDETIGRNASDNSEISLHRKGSIDRILDEAGERRQSLRGFDPEYVDIVDYIVRCTHRIWEEMGVGLIYTHYRHNSVIHAGNDEVYGREAVVANTLQTLAAFPDRKLYADEVVWSGDDETGFHTSHLLTTVSHNTGHGAYGPPTGRRVVWRAIANCFVLENQIVEEWLLRDEISVIRQLGLDPNRLAARQAEAALASGAGFPPRGPLERGVGQRMPETLPPPRNAGFDVEGFVRRAYHELWNWRLLNKVRDYHADNLRCRWSSGRRFANRIDYAAFLIALLAAFPDAKLTLDHVYWLGDDQEGYRVAARWTLAGTHLGPGEWGEPSGARVNVMGLSQHRIENDRFVEETTLFDEFALLKQIWTARLAAAAPSRDRAPAGD
ncbi:MAG: ester cyclase, partial [Chloroflexota bacterium]|nr:ester cyclase [Chloroflexota bacterium]